MCEHPHPIDWIWNGYGRLPVVWTEVERLRIRYRRVLKGVRHVLSEHPVDLRDSDRPEEVVGRRGISDQDAYCHPEIDSCHLCRF